MWRLTTAACVFVVGVVYGAREEDRILRLPGYAKPVDPPQYSGYLDVDTSEGPVSYHYWLAEAEPEAAESFGSRDEVPLVMWMNGGPGASSLGYGYFSELGPYYLDDSSLLNRTEPGVPDIIENPYSWTKVANMLFIEAPPSVGFSFCEKKNCRWNDTTQAEANYACLEKFFDEFAEYKDRDFFITGESYGGMYVPTLVEQIHRHRDSSIKLKGFAVGNGIIGHRDTFPGASRIHSEFLHNKAFISDHLWDDLVRECGAAWAKPGSPVYSKECQSLMAKAQSQAGSYYVYNVYDSCGNDQVTLQQLTDGVAGPTGYAGSLAGLIGRDPPVPCGKNNVAEIWLNNGKVREAIHMRPESFYNATYSLSAPFKFWPTEGWNYNESRPHLLDVYPEFIAQYRTLIFNGDFDGCVPYIHNDGWTSYLAKSKGWQRARDWEPWLLDDQVAGYVTQYFGPGANNFTFATVKGAGHMVPQYKPRQGLALFRSFVHGSPPLY